MKKIGKNAKLYLLGMLIGGIGFGLTTVIADTIINSTSVAYKTTTVKAAIDELYGLADLKPRVENLESSLTEETTTVGPRYLYTEFGLQLGKHESTTHSSFIDFFDDNKMAGNIYTDDNADGIYIAGKKKETGAIGPVTVYANPFKINDTNFEDMFITEKLAFDKVTLASGQNTGIGKSIHKDGYKPLITNCYAATQQDGDAKRILTYASRFESDTDHESVSLFYTNLSTSVESFYPTCEVLYVKKTAV